MKSPNFLNIHLEIRELIYTIYLTSPNALPPSSVTRAHRICRESQHDARLFGEHDDDKMFFSEHCNHYPDPTITPAVPASLSLLLCNRQMYKEVTSIVNFLTTHTKKLRYEIDCEIVDEVRLYPTWLHIPVRFTYAPIPCVYVNFRISGQFDDDDGRRSGWARRSGGPGKMMSSIMTLFDRFLVVGPNFIRPRMEIEVVSMNRHQSSKGESRIKLLLDRLFKGNLQMIDKRSSVTSNLPGKTTGVFKCHGPTEIRIEELVFDFAPSLLPVAELDARRDVAGEMIDPTQVAALMKEQLASLLDGAVCNMQSGCLIASRVKSVLLLICGKQIARWNLPGTQVDVANDEALL